jgi:hypothetical protein
MNELLVDYCSSNDLSDNEDSLPHVNILRSQPDPQAVAMVRQYSALKIKSSFDLTESIRGNKEFGNPYILKKTIDYFGIDEVTLK